MFSDIEMLIEGIFEPSRSSRLEQNYIMKVFILCTDPQNMNGVVNWKCVRWVGYVTHKGGDKREKLCSKNLNMRDNLGELGRVKGIILRVNLNK